MKLTKSDFICIVATLLIFWIGVARHIDSPGLYMDAVNPDYLAAKTLNPELNNTVWVLPTATFPILGNLYHGVQNYYLDLAVFRVFGISVPSIRIAQAIFGAGLIVFLYLIVLIATKNRVAAFVGAALLATDIAFVMSFRTQFYIILGGEMWFFASIAALLLGGFAGCFISGVCFALAIYGYFVLGFFAPAMICMVLLLPERRPVAWLLGGVLGAAPYIAGYWSLAAALGGIPQAIDWMSKAVHNLAPTTSQVRGLDKVPYVFHTAYLAMADKGNEIMLFQRYVSGIWSVVKVSLFAAVVVVSLAYTKRSRVMILVLLPVSYLVIAVWFGNRLWAHHFGVLVPIAYLLVAMLASHHLTSKVSTVAFCAIALTVGMLNLHQANNVYAALAETGGVGRASDALTRFAQDATDEPRTLYVFPEWGFFMPFELLTQNKVPYVIDLDNIGQAKTGFNNVVLAFWAEGDEGKYRAVLKQAGAAVINKRMYLQRDGRVAFYVLQGTFQ